MHRLTAILTTCLLVTLPARGQTNTGFAVVELFTSEGCSSCPPADALLNELARQPGIFALAFHVDYWNHLGWADPFSQPAFSERQRAYRSRSVYTPQMIVNGTAEFVGSDRAHAQRVIDAALASQPSGGVVFRVRSAKDKIDVEYQTTGVPPEALLHLALVESGIVQKVPRGENAGKTLTHENVVRVFRSQPVGNGTGHVELPTPRPNLRLIGFVQDPRSRAVLAAAYGN